MIEPSTTPIQPPVFIRSLKITTRLRLHPDFTANPRAYSRRHGVELADDVFQKTDFRKKSDEPDSERMSDEPDGERIEKSTANIHLVRHNAIRLFTDRNDEGDCVMSIDLNPARLLHKEERCRLNEGDLLLSLDILRTRVAPLLANPLDARHIVPGLRHGDDTSVAFWSEVDSEILLPGVQIPCLHNLSHPGTGPAEGATDKRIQLGDNHDTCVIRFKKARWKSAGPNGMEDVVDGIRVRLILKGRKLVGDFQPFGTTALIDDNRRLVSFTETSVGLVHQSMMAQLEGDYLPVPSEWKHKTKPKSVTHAKVMALVSRVTSIPPDDLRAIDRQIRHPSDSTRKRLKKDLQLEFARLTPVPVPTLFPSSVYAFRRSGVFHFADDIDPLIANTYGDT